MIDVLIVDDDFMVAKLHGGFVARIPGFEVVGAVHTGKDAIRACRDLQPDLVLLDVYLPDMTGLEVLARLRRDAPDLDVLVITAAREADTVRAALRSGVVHYLIKPFTFEDLRERLDHYARAYRGLDDLPEADQAGVDRIFGMVPSSGPASAPLPKGVSAETAARVEEALRAAPQTLSAAECAQIVGVSRVSARRYLEFFVSDHRADVELRYGRNGRPERRYAWVSAGG